MLDSLILRSPVLADVMSIASMSRYLCLLPLIVLLRDFAWWFEYANDTGLIPEFNMVIVHVVGVLILTALIGFPNPESIVGKLGFVWSALYLVQSVVSFQQFGFDGFLMT